MTRMTTAQGWAVLWLLVLACQSASSQEVKQEAEPKISGVIENYLWATDDGKRPGVRDVANWSYIQWKPSSKLRVVAGEFEVFSRSMLDETFVEWGGDKQQIRFGRFRSAFGHSDWSELWYSGFVRQPMLRNLGLGSKLSLNRLDTGVDWHGGSGNVQYQVGLIDAHARLWEPVPMRFNHLVGRVQLYKKDWIIGLNGLLGVDQWGNQQNRLFDLDWRWTAPHITLRGEFLVGRTAQKHSSGYYLDLFYHPPKLLRTTLLGRTEATSGAKTPQLFTLGVKQILSRYFTVELTHAWANNAPAASGRRGWALQLMTSLHF